MSRPKTTIGLAVGGLTALLIVGTAMAHPGGGIVHRVEVLAEALGITTAEVETAKTPQDAKGSSSEVRVVGTVIPGGGLVVAGAGPETAVQVADEAVGEGA